MNIAKVKFKVKNYKYFFFSHNNTAPKLCCIYCSTKNEKLYDADIKWELIFVERHEGVFVIDFLSSFLARQFSYDII